MVSHPAEYPLSSSTYQALFEAHLDDKTLNDVRVALNKVWGWVRTFQGRIEAQFNRRASPLPKGGNRGSEEVKNKTRRIQEPTTTVNV